MKNYVVYIHRGKTNSKVYIGITNNPDRRWRLNGIEYKPSKEEKTNGRRFWNAIQKYGWENFEHIILEDNLSFDEAIDREKFYIEKYDSTNRKKGYNISKGGNGGLIYEIHPKGMKGKSQTDHQKTTHKEWASKKENNCMTNGKVVWGNTHEHPRGMKGKTHSKEYRDRISKTFSRGGHPNAKKVKAKLNGTIKVFDCAKSCYEYYGISNSFFNRLVKSKAPLAMSPNNRWKNKTKHLIGLRVEYISDDTEVTS